MAHLLVQNRISGREPAIISDKNWGKFDSIGALSLSQSFEAIEANTQTLARCTLHGARSIVAVPVGKTFALDIHVLQI